MGRPPCRLLHVVDGGDFGYQEIYGSAPFHPFVGWNGELLGTLPMVHALAEAPCGVVPLGGGLLIGSWSDNRLDFHSLKRSGASFESKQIPLVRATELFRPTCITKANDTTFYMADWVWGTYQVHGRGRVWKIEVDPDKADWFTPREPEPRNHAAILANSLRSGPTSMPHEKLLKLAANSDPYLAHAAIQAMARTATDWSLAKLQDNSDRNRVSMLLARKRAAPEDTQWVAAALTDPSSEMRFESLRWIADHRLIQFAPQVDQLLLSPDLSYRLFEACLAAHNMLAGNPTDGISDPAVLLATLHSNQTPASIRAFALRLLPADHPELSSTLLDEFLAMDEEQLVLEAVRTLSARRDARSATVLRKIAEDPTRSSMVRTEAIAGLATDTGPHLSSLLQLAANTDPAIRSEVLRTLRFSPVDETTTARLTGLTQRFPETKQLVEAVITPGSLKADRPAPSDIEAWLQLVENTPEPADAATGRRIFYHAKVGLCANCHRHFGRGNVVGPDLTAVAATGDRKRLLQAILQPSRDVAPQYYSRMIETEDGRTFTGIMLRKGGRTSRDVYRDSQGRERSFLWSDIVMRKNLQKSLMPDGLVDMLTISELRDLIAFLEQGR